MGIKTNQALEQISNFIIDRVEELKVISVFDKSNISPEPISDSMVKFCEDLTDKQLSMVTARISEYFNEDPSNESLETLDELNKMNFFPKSLSKHIVSFVNEEFEKSKNITKCFQQINENCVVVTMFRGDESKKLINLEQNEIFKKEFIKLAKLEKLEINIKDSVGFWYEEGESNLENGFTISTINKSSESFDCLIDVTKNILENYAKFGLNEENQQMGFYAKFEDKSMIYCIDENLKYNLDVELNNNITFTDKNINKEIFKHQNDPSSLLSKVGGTEINGVMLMSFNEEQQKEFLESVLPKFDISKTIYYDNKNIIKENVRDISFNFDFPKLNDDEIPF